MYGGETYSGVDSIRVSITGYPVIYVISVAIVDMSPKVGLKFKS